EGNAGTVQLQVPVTLNAPSDRAVIVPWTTLLIASPGLPPGQADPGTDYTAASGAVTFAPGETATTVTIVVNGDTEVDDNEYLLALFHNPRNAVMGGFLGLGGGQILNDDTVVLPGVAAVVEGSSGPTTLQVPVTLSKPSAVEVTVPWTTLFIPGL